MDKLDAFSEALHVGGEGLIGGRPGGTRVVVESGAENHFQRPEQRFTDGCVMVRLDAIGVVAAAEVLDFRLEPVKIGEAVDDLFERDHEFFTLLAHIGGREQGSGFGIDGEQARVEDAARLVGDHFDLFPGRLHDFDLAIVHEHFKEETRSLSLPAK